MTTARQHECPVRAFLNTSAVAPNGVPTSAAREALHVDLVWNIINRLANTFGFALRGNQLHTGTRALHRFGYRFPAYLLAGGTRTTHEDPVDRLRHAVFEAPAVTAPTLRQAATTGEGLAEPWQSYTARVRAASHTVTDADIAQLTAAGHTEDEIFELTVAAATGAALHTFNAGKRALEHISRADIPEPHKKE